MSERVNAILVTLKKEMREDDVKHLLRAIMTLKNVGVAEPMPDVDNFEFHTAKHQAKMEIWEAIRKPLSNEIFGELFG